MSAELFEERLICAVAQAPFEVPGGGRLSNIFCTVVPLWHEDGEPAHARDFPNNGLIWWKLRPGDVSLAQPGRLISAPVEYALRYSPDDPDKQLYQLVSAEVEALADNEAIEFLRADTRVIRSPRELVNAVGALETHHPPGAIVLVALGASVYGPLLTSIAASSKGLYRVSVRAAAADGTVRQSTLAATERVISRMSDVLISNDNTPPHRSHNVRHDQFEVVRADAIDDLLRPAPVVELPRDEDLIARAARRLLTRRERQELGDLLDKLGDLLTDDDAPDERELVAALRRRTGTGGPADLELARAVLTSGLLEDRIEQALSERTRAHIEEHATAITTQVEQRTAAATARLQELDRERAAFERDLEQRARELEGNLQARIDEAWREHHRRTTEERELIEAEKASLESQRRTLLATVESAAERYTTGQQAVIADALALLPVLDALGRARDQAPGAASAATDTTRPRLELPSFVTEPHTSEEVDEQSFVERFERVVAANGLKYHSLDLRVFHNAYKCGELILVTGPPGTGKSSLPRLYADALAGTLDVGDPASVTRFLRVPVRSTWLDSADLLGFVNPAERAFEPSASGVLRQLIATVEEYQRHGARAGMHTLCFDDADLAPIDSWLGDLLQVIGGTGERLMRVFDPAAVPGTDPFAAWATLLLPHNFRCVCTLTGSGPAGPPARRVYDRAAIVRLRPSADPLTHPGGRRSGAPLALEQIDRWTRERPLPAAIRTALTRLAPALERAHVPISPRSERLLARLVASAPPILDPVSAFDAQLAGGWLAPAHLDGEEAEQLLDLMDSFDVELPQCEDVLHRHREDSGRFEI
jgi:hypothetical protein